MEEDDLQNDNQFLKNYRKTDHDQTGDADQREPTDKLEKHCDSFSSVTLVNLNQIKPGNGDLRYSFHVSELIVLQISSRRIWDKLAFSVNGDNPVCESLENLYFEKN
jgi:hypothetical protein